MLKYFRGLRLRQKYITMKIYTRYIRNITLRKRKIHEGSLRSRLLCVPRHLGGGGGCSDGMRHVSSHPLPSLKLSAFPCSQKRLLLPVLQMKVSPLGPFWLRSLLGSPYCLYTVTQLVGVRVIDSLLKILCVKNVHGLSQPRKYFNNKNFPNYSN